MISLPRSQVEMTEGDLVWQERITKVVKRVAKDLLVNDEAEISEVLRLRLFENLGKEPLRKVVALAYANWCFEHRAQFNTDVTAVDSAATEQKAREYLRGRFEACYPFHPSTLTVFQRKWRTVSQFQQTRGALAMFAQWVSIAFAADHRRARPEPLITLGSAPLEDRAFRSVVLGQLGEVRLEGAINSDIAGEQNKAAALDSDAKGALKEIHRRVGAAILFESSGGQTDQIAHLPELRFALGGPEVDTTSIDNAAIALEGRAFYIRKAGTDGYRFGLKPKLEKVVHDRRASLDEAEIRKSIERLVDGQFRIGAALHIQKAFPKDSTDVEDMAQLNLVVVDPDEAWEGNGTLRGKLAEWTRMRGRSPRLYPASMIWCIRKAGRELRDRVEDSLAWQRVHREITDGTIGAQFEPSELKDVVAKVKMAESAAQDEVWASYRYIVFADPKSSDGLREIDLGAGHSSGSKSLCDRVLGALKSNTLLNDSPGAGYLDRRWPQAFKETGAWPIKSLRQAFLDGSLDRLISPDEYLKRKIPEFVANGDFGLASGDQPGGTFEHLWFKQPVSPDEVSFDPDVYLVKRDRAAALKAGTTEIVMGNGGASGTPPIEPGPEVELPQEQHTGEEVRTRTLLLSGSIPPESWNKVGTRLIPKLRSGSQLNVEVTFSVQIDAAQAAYLKRELEQILADLNLSDKLKVEPR